MKMFVKSYILEEPVKSLKTNSILYSSLHVLDIIGAQQHLGCMVMSLHQTPRVSIS